MSFERHHLHVGKHPAPSVAFVKTGKYLPAPSGLFFLLHLDGGFVFRHYVTYEKE